MEGPMNLVLPLRKIVHRTRGYGHGPIVRLMSPSDLGEELKPFVFLDLFEADMRNLAGSMPVHPHSGIATVTVFTNGGRDLRRSAPGARNHRLRRRRVGPCRKGHVARQGTLGWLVGRGPGLSALDRPSAGPGERGTGSPVRRNRGYADYRSGPSHCGGLCRSEEPGTVAARGQLPTDIAQAR